MKKVFRAFHDFITQKMSESDFVERFLIAKFTDEDGTFDCIYCTILRNAVLFGIIGFSFGFLVRWLLW